MSSNLTASAIECQTFMPRFLQLSDIHLCQDPNQLLFGVNTQATFAAVLQNVLQQPPDFVVLSGDLSQDGSLASYRQLAQMLAILPCPVYWLAGNHDDMDCAKAGLVGGNLRPEKSILLADWQIILLDSTAPGLEDGFLSDIDFAHLNACLVQHPQHLAIVMLHHPPVKIGCYMDEVRLINDTAFLEKTAQYPQIQAVLFGHIHQAFALYQQNVWYLGAPSTCVQFKPNQAKFAIDSTLNPGYRWVECQDRELRTDITG